MQRCVNSEIEPNLPHCSTVPGCCSSRVLAPISVQNFATLGPFEAARTLFAIMHNQAYLWPSHLKSLTRAREVGFAAADP